MSPFVRDKTLMNMNLVKIQSKFKKYEFSSGEPARKKGPQFEMLGKPKIVKLDPP